MLSYVRSITTYTGGFSLYLAENSCVAYLKFNTQTSSEVVTQHDYAIASHCIQ